MAGFGRPLKKLLEDHGCYYVRPGKGDHQIWYSPILKRNFSVDFNSKSRFTANGILKQAGIDAKL
jgi:hypothetical protein